MNSLSRTFGARVYPRDAIETAALAFRDICQLQLEDEISGTRVVMTLPGDGIERVMDEFSNVALSAAIELRLGAGAP